MTTLCPSLSPREQVGKCRAEAERPAPSTQEVQECWQWECLSSTSREAGSTRVYRFLVEEMPPLATPLQTIQPFPFYHSPWDLFCPSDRHLRGPLQFAPRADCLGLCKPMCYGGPVVSCPSVRQQHLCHLPCDSWRHGQSMSSPGVVVSEMKPGSISRLREDGESSGG